MKKSELKALIREVVETMVQEWNSESDGVDIPTSKGVYKFWAELEKEEDNQKWFHYVKGPDGVPHFVDLSPYEEPYSKENVQKVKSWIESGMPENERLW